MDSCSRLSQCGRLSWQAKQKKIRPQCPTLALVREGGFPSRALWGALNPAPGCRHLQPRRLGTWEKLRDWSGGEGQHRHQAASHKALLGLLMRLFFGQSSKYLGDCSFPFTEVQLRNLDRCCLGIKSRLPSRGCAITRTWKSYRFFHAMRALITPP